MLTQNDKLTALTHHANAVNQKFNADLAQSEQKTEEPEGNEWKHADDEPEEIVSEEVRPEPFSFNYDNRSKGLSGYEGGSSQNN